MTKELFVSSTPHETKVGMVEDDQLAEIYLERENEYTLAGSIYKGRVTRVLPGMQSAFVDIGLERDAFLYVSDFMELEDSEDLDEVPTNRPVLERHPQPQPPTQTEAHDGETFAAPIATEPQEHSTEVGAENHEPDASGESRDNRGGMRGGRRRRRGRRGERPESKFASPVVEAPREAPRGERPDRTERPERTQRNERPEFSERGRSERPARTDRSERSEYGPPPGYQPIILPGESISKYQRLAQTRPAAVSERSASPAQGAPVQPIAEIFADDEPIFASASASAPAYPVESQPAFYDEAPAQSRPVADDESSAYDREQQRLHQMNVAAVFGGESTEQDDHEDDSDDTADVVAEMRELAAQHSDQPASAIAARAVEEEEIEEEEADLAHYVEELEEDAAFEELEEETHAAGEHEQHTQEIAASADPAASLEAVPFSAEAISSEEVDIAAADDVDEEAEDEAELDEAQAEAEAASGRRDRGSGNDGSSR